MMKRIGVPQVCFAVPNEGAGGGAPAPAATSTPAPSAAPAAPSSPAAAPSPAPSAAPSGAPAAPSGNPETIEAPFDFGTVLGGEDETIPASPEPTVAPVVPPVVAPVVPPVAAEAPKPGQPAAPLAVSPPPPPPAQDTSPPLDPAQPKSLADAILQNESAIVDNLATTMFKLSPEDIEALNENAVEVIPKLMARSFVRSQHNMLTQMANTVPRMIEGYLKVTKRNEENAGKFYSRWTNIKREEHGPLVDKYAHNYRQLNPTATLETMIEDVGMMVMMAAKLPQVAAPGVAAAAPHPMAAATNGSRPPQPTPFVPASGGPGAPQPAAEGSPWDILGGEPEG